MTLLPPGVKVHVAPGYVDMRKGLDGLSMLVQGVLRQDPFSGHLFVFRGRTRANLIKIVFWDGTGLCLFTKRLEHGVCFYGPRAWSRARRPSSAACITATPESSDLYGQDQGGGMSAGPSCRSPAPSGRV
jgi:transposase